MKGGYKLSEVGTTCANNKGYSGIASKSECKASVKSPDVFIDDPMGKGHDLPSGCIADALSLNKKSVYWNPGGVATSNDPKVREVCAQNRRVGKRDNHFNSNVKYCIILDIWYTSIDSFYTILISDFCTTHADCKKTGVSCFMGICATMGT